MLLFFEEPVLLFFGADANLLVLTQTYLKPVQIVAPLFLLNQMPTAFLRNDGNPASCNRQAPFWRSLPPLSGAIPFPLLPLNIFSTYYFQTLMNPRAAFIVSVFRGCVISCILILLLPAVAGADFIWFAMPVTELVIAVYAVRTIART